MSREEIHRLVGGYATGTLTAEEREALFAAALEDQELFDAMAREQALCDLLSDPASKAQLLAALEEKPSRWFERMGWLRPWRSLGPAALAMAGAAVLAVIALRPNVTPTALAPAVPVAQDKLAAVAPLVPTEKAGSPVDRAAEPTPLADRMRRAEPPAAQPATVARKAGASAQGTLVPPALTATGGRPTDSALAPGAVAVSGAASPPAQPAPAPSMAAPARNPTDSARASGEVASSGAANSPAQGGHASSSYVANGGKPVGSTLAPAVVAVSGTAHPPTQGGPVPSMAAPAGKPTDSARASGEVAVPGSANSALQRAPLPSTPPPAVAATDSARASTGAAVPVAANPPAQGAPPAPSARPAFAATAGASASTARAARMAAPSASAPVPAPAPMAPPPPPVFTLDGTVTDSSGAVLRDATVTVASDNQAVKKQAKTDAQGNWSLQMANAGQYQVTVDAPGFQTGRAGVELPSADSKQVNLQLTPGLATETVQVTAASPLITPFQQAETAGQLQQQAGQQGLSTMASARGGLGGFGGPGGRGGGGGGGRAAPSARQLYDEAAAQPEAKVIPVRTISGAGTLAAIRGEIAPAIGLRYTLVSKTSSGGGNTVAIQFTPAADGYLTVATLAGAVLVPTTRVEHLKPFTTRPLPQGEKQVAVTYSRPAPAAAAKSAAKSAAKEALDTPPALTKPVQETVAGITYVATRTAQGGLGFTIDLK